LAACGHYNTVHGTSLGKSKYTHCVQYEITVTMSYQTVETTKITRTKIHFRCCVRLLHTKVK